MALPREFDAGTSDWELSSLRARVAFWKTANDRMARLANRLGPEQLKPLRIAIHKRIP